MPTKMDIEASTMAHQIKLLAAKTEGLDLILRTHITERET